MKSYITAFFVMVCLTHLAWSKVNRDERVLLVISELDSDGIPELKPLYTALEQLTEVKVSNILGNEYKEIFFLLNDDATFEKFRNKVRELADDTEIKAIDVIVSLHGLPGGLAFADRTLSLSRMEEIFNQASSAEELALVEKSKRKLRMLYNLACYGETHRSSFLNMGFDVVNGSVDINANAGMEFVPALEAWKKGVSFKRAFILSNNPFALALNDGPIRREARRIDTSLVTTDSKKEFSGYIKTKISSDPR
jgi:hypothetical protein